MSTFVTRLRLRYSAVLLAGLALSSGTTPVKAEPAVDLSFVFSDLVVIADDATPAPDAAEPLVRPSPILASRLLSESSGRTAVHSPFSGNRDHSAGQAERLSSRAVTSAGGTERSRSAAATAAAASDLQADLAALALGRYLDRFPGTSDVARPATQDAGDDEYVYGYRLWRARYYAEAQQQLALYLRDYPGHWRETYARNLLGRAFLDQGQPRMAAEHFLTNYEADIEARRAPDSLLLYARSMAALGETHRACNALDHFGQYYAELAAGRLRYQFEATRSQVSCGE